MKNLPENSEVQKASEANELRRLVKKMSKATDEIVEATGQAFYLWDIASDEIEWSRNFSKLVGLNAKETRHLKGRQFESMLGSQSKETRFGVIVSSGQSQNAAGPVPYQCIYLFLILLFVTL